MAYVGCIRRSIVLPLTVIVAYRTNHVYSHRYKGTSRSGYRGSVLLAGPVCVCVCDCVMELPAYLACHAHTTEQNAVLCNVERLPGLTQFIDR